MAALRATGSLKTMILIFVLAAALPAAALAQATGGSAGSTGGAAGSAGGVANSPAPPPGTNSLGTAQSSGAGGGGAAATGGGTDAAVAAENRMLDKKLKSICRGC